MGWAFYGIAEVILLPECQPTASTGEATVAGVSIQDPFPFRGVTVSTCLVASVQGHLMCDIKMSSSESVVYHLSSHISSSNVHLQLKTNENRSGPSRRGS